LLASAEPDVSKMLTDLQTRAVQRKCPACYTGTLHVIGWIAPAVLIDLGTPICVDTS
jgi:hypothetical protein